MMLTLTRPSFPSPHLQIKNAVPRTGQNQLIQQIPPSPSHSQFKLFSTTADNIVATLEQARQAKIEENTPLLAYQAHGFLSTIAQEIPLSDSKKALTFLQTLIPSLQQSPAVQEALLANEPAHYIKQLLRTFQTVGTAIQKNIPLSDVPKCLQPIVESLQTASPKDFKDTHGLTKAEALQQGLTVATALLTGSENTVGLPKAVKGYLETKHQQLQQFKPYRQSNPLFDYYLQGELLQGQVNLIKQAQQEAKLGLGLTEIMHLANFLSQVLEAAIQTAQVEIGITTSIKDSKKRFIKNPQSSTQGMINLKLFLQKLQNNITVNGKPYKAESLSPEQASTHRQTYQKLIDIITDSTDSETILTTWYTHGVEPLLQYGLEHCTQFKQKSTCEEALRRVKEDSSIILAFLASTPLEKMLTDTLSCPSLQSFTEAAVSNCSKALTNHPI